MNESTKTWGVKVPETLSTEATNMMKLLGLSGEDFLNDLMTAYKSEKAKEQIPAVARDIKELQTLTRRIFNIYLNLGYSIENIEKTKDSEMQDKLTKKDTLIESLQDEIEEISDKYTAISQAFNNSVDDKNNLEIQVNQLTDTLNSNKELINEYKNKNDMLTGLLNEYKGYKDSVNEYKSNISKLEDSVKDVTNRLDNTTIELNKANEIISNMDSSHSNDIERLNQSHKDDINKIIEQEQMKKERDLLNKDKEHQNIINELSSKHNQELRSMIDENKTLNNRIAELLEEIATIKSNANKKGTQKSTETTGTK